MRFSGWPFLALLFLFSNCSDKDPFSDPASNSHKKQKPLMEKMPHDQTGMIFENTLKETSENNIFSYEYYYNGGGVGVADFDNNGFPDIYFAANESEDALFLNQGKWKFEDNSQSSGIQNKNTWSTGVSVVDINGDGWMDIYVCASGPINDGVRNRNQLLINQKDGTFKDEAAAYGLDYVGHSTQALFIDADRDGDLDMYLMTHPILNGGVSFTEFQALHRQGKLETDRFYKQTSIGTFVDVSKECGIEDLGFGFGLGLASGDLNEDGFTDIYVANDYDEPDLIWLNDGGGKFSNGANEMLPHMSNYSMGCDVADINKDGRLDLFTADMAFETHYRSKTNMPTMRPKLFNQRVKIGYHYQYMHNTLQINRGEGKFSEIANYAGVAKSDWSWSALIEDVNQDGKNDIFITNGYRRDVRENDLRRRISEKQEEQQSTAFELADIFELVTSKKIANRLFLQEQNLKFNKLIDSGLDDPTFSNGAAMADLDGDGDLDLVVNNLDMKSALYQNHSNQDAWSVALKGEGLNSQALGAEITLHFLDGKKEIHNIQNCRGYQSSTQKKVLILKESGLEKLVVKWPNGEQRVLTSNELKAEISSSDGAPWTKESNDDRLFNMELVNSIPLHKEDSFDDFEREILLPHRYSNAGPALAAAFDKALGEQIVFVGSAYNGTSHLLYPDQNLKAVALPNTERFEDVSATFFDLENDGDQDLYVVSGGAHFPKGSPLFSDRLYVNNGGVFQQQKLPRMLPLNGGGVCAGDINGDGFEDLFVWSQYAPGSYGEDSEFHLLINENGNLRSNNERLQCELSGMISSALFWDYDGDKDLDLVVAGEWMGIHFLNNVEGKFAADESMQDFANLSGWWQNLSLYTDNEGIEHLIAGNIGDNNKFHPSNANPLLLYAADFDANGTHDIVLGKKEEEKLVPLRGRECTSEQMPIVAQNFPDYASFADASLGDIIPLEDPNLNVVARKAVEFRHWDIYHNGTSWQMEALPAELQWSPLRTAIQVDHPDYEHPLLFCGGNHYGTEVETTRYDGGYGALTYFKNKTWHVVPPLLSGILFPADHRNSAATKEGFLLTSSNGPLVHFSKEP